MILKIKPAIGSLLACSLYVLALSGCGDQGIIKPDAATQKKQEENGTALHDIFARCNGNFDTCSAADQEAAIKILNGEQNVRTAFSHMSMASSSSVPPGR